MNKCHTPITWHNDTTPAINETNLNYEDGCIDTIDDRVVAMDTSKANQSDLLKAFKDVSLNTTTGVITFTLFDNTTKTIDTLLEKVAINFDYDDNPSSAHYQNLIIELEDGTYKYIDMSALITEYEFTTSDTIAFTVDQDGAVSASVRDGSITGAKLQPNYLADVTAQANIASGAATTATNKATLAKSYAVGGTGTRAGEDTDNAKYYKEQAQAIAQQSLSGLSDVNITTPSDGDALVYDANSGEWVNGASASSASDISYDNTASGLTATDVQDAVDEVNGAMQYLYNNTGGKNVLPYPYYHTTKADQGITFTDNGDGTINVNGTCGSGTYVEFRLLDDGYIGPGNYIISGCPSGGSLSTYYIIVKADGSWGTSPNYNTDTGSGLTLTVTTSITDVRIRVMTGTVISTPITFKPMIRDASIADDTYVPYAMTNRELTERISGVYINGSGISVIAQSQLVNYTPTKDGILVITTNSSGIGYGILQFPDAGTSIGFANTISLPIKKNTHVTTSGAVYIAYFIPSN